MSKIALILGISGQDGSYLAEQLLAAGYEVHGTVRRASTINTSRIDHIFDKIKLHYCDITDAMSVASVVREVEPWCVYNLAAQSHVGVSFETPSYTSHTAGLGTLHVLEAVRLNCPETRVYQASSSEMFGNMPAPQSERTDFSPRSPYACAKVYAHYLAEHYRRAYDMHVSCGILFNHESERRGETFVTRKITLAAARIKRGLQKKLLLGNLDAVRDWGYAPEYTRAMQLMVEAPESDTYVIGTGETASVEQFLHLVFSLAGLTVEDHVEISPRYRRPQEVNYLQAWPTLAEHRLKWTATTTWRRLAGIMFEHDLALAGKESVA